MSRRKPTRAQQARPHPMSMLAAAQRRLRQKLDAAKAKDKDKKR